MMKQSTSFAKVATNLLNVLQGYSKTIRLLLVMFLTLTVSANTWGQTTATLTLSSSKKFGTTSGSTLTDDKNNTWTCTGSTIQNTYNNTYKGQQFGTSKNAGNYTFTCTIAGATISSVKITAAAGSTSAKYSISVGGSSKYSGNLSKTSTTYGGTNASGSGEISISLQGSGTGAAVYLGSITVIYTTASATKHTVTFDAGTNGTCSTPSLTEASAGAGVTLPTVTPNSGYRFLGWATTSAATTANAGKAGENYKPSSNITLYAIYVQQYTIQWYADGTLLEAKTYDKGSPIQAPTVSVTPCEGMQHVGWTTISDYAHATEAPSSFFDEDTPLGNATFNMKFYALFAKVEGPTETPTTLTETIKFTNFSSGTSTRTYESTSANWTWKKNDGSNIAEYDEIRLYAKHSMTIAPKTECSISKIVATCTSNSYATALGGSSLTGADKSVSGSTVTIEPIGGNIVIIQAAQSRVSQFVVTFTASVSSGQKYSNYTTQCTTETADCSLLKFASNIAANYTATYAQNATATALTVLAKYDGNSTGVTYQWYSNTTESNTGGTVISGATNASYTPATTAVGTKYYYCVATYDECTITSNIATIVVNPTFTVTFNSDGGSTVTAQTIEKGKTATKPTNPTKTGYTFAGWYLDDTEFDFTTPITSNITLKAKWTIKQYTVTLNPNYPAGKTGVFKDKDGNTVNDNLVLTFDYNTASQTLTDLYQSIVLEGYQFNGWYNATAGGSKWTSTGTITKDVTVYAQWSKLYTVILSENGTTTEPTSQSSTSYKLPTELSVGNCENDEKELVGWSTVAIPTPGDKPASNFYELGEPVTLTADQTTFYAVFATPGEGESIMTEETATLSFEDKAQRTEFSTTKQVWEQNGIIFTNNKANSSTDIGDYANPVRCYKSSEIIIDCNALGNIAKVQFKCSSSAYASDLASSIGVEEATSLDTWATLIPTSESKTYTITLSNGQTRISFLTVTYKAVSDNATTTYSEYTTTCVKLPDPVLTFATEPANPIVFTDAVCGGNSSKQSVTVVGENLRDVVNVSVTGPYKIARTSSTPLKDFTPSLTLDKTAAGAIHSNYQTVYIISTPPAQSTEATTGTLTFTTTKGNTLTVNLSTPTVTCTQYTLTLVDRGVSTEQPTKYYAGETIDEAPADPEGVCTDPIHYVFDGWAEAKVDEGSTTYTKVSFPYTMPAKATTLYAVYRYVEDGSADSGDYVKLTEDLDDYSGDYLIVYEAGSLALNGALVGDGLDASGNSISVTITDNTIVATDEVNASNFTIAKEDDGYSIQSASGYYIGWSTADKNGLNANSKYSANYYLNTISNSIISGVKGTLKFNKTSGQERFRYYQSGQESIALYRKAASYLYTTSPVCGPHLAITEGKEIYVTGGNAKAARDLVMAQQKVSYKATRLNTKDGSAGGTAPDVVVANNGITKNGIVTSEVKVTFENTIKEQQADGTYTITGDIVVTYEAEANNLKEDIQVQLAADYNAEAKDNFTVHARSLPSEFVIVAKSGDKWYALNADMSSSKAQPANGQVTLNDLNNPTEATFAPCNAIYTFEAMPQGAEDRISVRFIGQDNKYLWAASGTNTGIQNYSTNPAADALAYNWKLYTEDNITYRFGNANSSRQLTLNGEKFGMYASGVQDIRILPYEAKCLYNYAPSNLTVKELKGSYVVLTWDAVAGATKYQYSTNGTTWTDAGTEPTVTINGLEGDTEYTYYIRAYHEDAGVSQECIDYAEVTFTTADCDDVPTNITYTADLNSITVSWTAAASTATIKLYLDEKGEHALFSQDGTTSPWKISTLSKNTTYYLQIFSGGTCASPIIPVKTEDVEVDIVEWQPQGIVVDINTNEAIGVTLENEVSYGSNVGAEATELFFSKYYEATGNVKLIAVYNGTKNIIDLTDYTIQYGRTSWESSYITLKEFGATKGQIQPSEEIILYSMQEKNAEDDEEIMDCVHEQYPDGTWVQVKSSNNTGKGSLSFAGDKTIVLKKAGTIIDIIGAVNSSGLPTNEAVSKPTWGDAKGWTCDTGLSIADDTQIGISTNRCLLIRNNTVTSGENAVAQNIGDFVTLCSEWKGAQVPDNDDDNGVAASCENFAYVGTFDYSDYYTKYEPIGNEQNFDENERNADGTVTIEIPDLYKHACSNIRVKLTNSKGEVLTDREYKVPIMITSDQTTAGQTFLDLQQNLATVEVDGEGNVINTYPLSLDEVREICKTCDVVVRDNATLTKVTDGTENDHPQVHDVIVYEGASIVIPNGTDHNYTINSLSLRRKGDDVASAQVQGIGKFVLPAEVPVTLSMRIDANNWHWFTLPYNCDIADVTWSDGTEAKYNTDWFLMYYDGESRSNQKSNYESHWKVYNGTTIEAGKGYIIGITGDLTHPDYTFELRFPMAQEVLTEEQTDKTVAVNAWGVKKDIRPNHKGWNLVGNPYMDYYQPNANGFAGLPLIKYLSTNSAGEWLYDDSGTVPFLVIPQDGGWSEYKQELASDVDMQPFTAYFVQVGDPKNEEHSDGVELNARFEADKRGRSSLIRRAPTEVDELEEPAIVAVSLTNAKGESDKTTLLIADRFTNEYEMNADFFKWFGDYYTYYTKPVLYTLGADKESRAFNALNEELATQPVALGMYAAQAGNYTFSLHQRSNLTGVAEVWLHDASNNTHTNLLQDDYTFSTSKTNGSGRFSLSVKMIQKLPTDVENIKQGNVWATTQDNEIVINGLAKDMQLWIYDATGKLVHADRSTNYQHSYSVPQTGAYFIRVQNQNGAQTIKVVVE